MPEFYHHKLHKKPTERKLNHNLLFIPFLHYTRCGVHPSVPVFNPCCFGVSREKLTIITYFYVFIVTCVQSAVVEGVRHTVRQSHHNVFACFPKHRFPSAPLCDRGCALQEHFVMNNKEDKITNNWPHQLGENK